MKWRSLALWLTLCTTVLAAQENRRVLSNSDVMNMAKSGMSDRTIVLAIQQTPTKFDTTPEALIALKKAGISDEVLNAMLLARPETKISAPDSAVHDGREFLDKVLNTFGTPEQLASVHSLHQKFISTQVGGGSFDWGTCCSVSG